MGEKDKTEKILEAHNDVFSDIVNTLFFHGRPVISADELEEQAPRSYYKADGTIREIERDVAKRWKKENIRLACVGLENQTEADPDMPLRVIGYDGAEYRAQLLTENEEKSRLSYSRVISGLSLITLYRCVNPAITLQTAQRLNTFKRPYSYLV